MSGVGREYAQGVPELVGRVRPAPATNGTAAEPVEQRSPLAVLLLALLVGALVRGWHIWSADFPLNDGGLFYVMVRDIQQAHYHLPAFTSYNDARIPFGYSPFSFYLTAVLNDVTGASLVTLFRVLPFLASTACIAAFYLLAREMLGSRASVAASLLAFAVVPRGFVWLLMGGGMTRSFGYLFALLALHQVWLLYTRRSLRYVPLATLFSGLTVLSHLGTAPFVAFSAMLLFLFRGRHREGVIGALLIGAGTLVLTAPWWATVIATHGTGPFLAARATGGSIISDISSDHHATLGVLSGFGRRTTGEGRFALIWVLALLGVVWSLRERRVLLPVWWITILLLDTRAGFTYSAAPVAMLAGLSSAHMIWPLVAPRGHGRRWTPPRLAAAGVLGVLALLAIVSAASPRFSFGGETQVLTALTPADRDAMVWMARNTDSSARVLVLAEGPWQIDKASEWFPVFAQRRSVATVQGTEWLPHDAFQAFIRRQSQVTACANATTACLESLATDPALRFTHVYAPHGPATTCCRGVTDALSHDPRYRVIYSNEAATVFARDGSGGAATSG